MISRCAAEVDAWREVKDGWRPLYGDVDQFGVAVDGMTFEWSVRSIGAAVFIRAASSFV